MDNALLVVINGQLICAAAVSQLHNFADCSIVHFSQLRGFTCPLP